MRKNTDQKEDYIKKIKHIDYTFSQIHNLNGKKLENFCVFLKEKTLIFIVSNEYLKRRRDIDMLVKGESNKVKEGSDNNNINSIKKEGKSPETPLEVISILTKIQSHIKILILNSPLNAESLEKSNGRLHDLLNQNTVNQTIPYILFNYRHVNNINLDGFFFVHFNVDHQKYSFNKYISAIEQKGINPPEECFFLKQMKITTKILYDSDFHYLEIGQKTKEYEFLNLKFMDYDVLWQDLVENQTYVLHICDWVMKEMHRGHSVYVNVRNYKETDFGWVMVVAVILCVATYIDINDILNYFKNKIVFLPNFSKNLCEYIKENKLKINEILNDCGLKIN